MTAVWPAAAPPNRPLPDDEPSRLRPGTPV
jgi:hypothetical protein